MIKQELIKKYKAELKIAEANLKESEERQEDGEDDSRASSHDAGLWSGYVGAYEEIIKDLESP